MIIKKYANAKYHNNYSTILLLLVFFSDYLLEKKSVKSLFYCLMIHISDNINDYLLQVLLNTHQS